MLRLLAAVPMILLDLFCGAGGAAVGYARAGFDVVGVDVRPQPAYPFDFVRADAMDFDLDGFDVIHASPPCQRWSRGSRRWGPITPIDHADLIGPIRERLRDAGVPYVIENVRRSPLLFPTQFCGTGLGLRVERHRWFESSIALLSPGCMHGTWPKDLPSNRGSGKGSARVWSVAGHGGTQRAGADVWHDALQLDADHRPTIRAMADMVPPAYTEAIGQQIADLIERGHAWRS